MFDDGDAKRLSELGDLVPDGVFDDTKYAKILSNVFDSIVQLDKNDSKTMIQFMMDCINSYINEQSEFSSDPVSDVVVALAYFTTNLYSYLSEEQKEIFFRYHNDHVIPETFKECEAMPFYEIESMFPNESGKN
jgi:hypothetical protein